MRVFLAQRGAYLAILTAASCHTAEQQKPASPGPTDFNSSVHSLFLVPQAVVMLKHCDKDRDNLDDPHCNDEGYARAGKLVAYTQTDDPMLSKLPAPDQMYVMSKKNPIKSVRGLETAYPIAGATGATINGYGARHWQNAVNDILSNPDDQGTPYMVWHHTELANIAQALGCPNAPKKYDSGGVNDRTWVITYDQDTGCADTFYNLAQGLMPGDSTYTPDPVPCNGPLDGSANTCSEAPWSQPTAPAPADPTVAAPEQAAPSDPAPSAQAPAAPATGGLVLPTSGDGGSASE